MLVKVKSAYFCGIQAFDVDVEVNFIDRSMPGIEIVGLPGREVTESRERVKSAVLNSLKEFPYNKKIVINLAPADVPKEGAFYDLPIAAAIISYLRGIIFPLNSAFFGEVSLDGTVRKTKGAFLFSSFAKSKGLNNLFIPFDCLQEVLLIKDINIYPIKSLTDLLKYQSLQSMTNLPGVLTENDPVNSSTDFSEVIGQEVAKRALEICAAGGHNVLLHGSPGGGKTMLARALTGIMPSLSDSEQEDVVSIYSAAGVADQSVYRFKQRPFRSPHHTISYTGMVGGGAVIRPGEISLAHKGVLFMDEFSEFPTTIIECLRQPMEDKFITISRSRGSIKLPCDFTLVACTNPCPCGYNGEPGSKCTCRPGDVLHYKKKISGPISDRIDLFAHVWTAGSGSMVGADVCFEDRAGTSETIKSGVIKAREIQLRRFEGSNVSLNSNMTNLQVRQFCVLDSQGKLLLDRSISRYHLSVRSVFKIIKVARTIADIEGREKITSQDLAEAVQFKSPN